MGGCSPRDLVCLGRSAIAIAAWVSTGDAKLAVYAGIGTTVLGYLPILSKARSRPETENLTSWAMCLAAAILNLSALTGIDPSITLRPLASVLGAGAVTWLLMAFISD